MLALPDTGNAAEVKAQIAKLRAIPEPGKREELADKLESLGLDIRGSLHEARGQRDLAIADYERAIALDSSQKNARDGLERLKVPSSKPDASHRVGDSTDQNEDAIQTFAVAEFSLSKPISKDDLTSFDCLPSDYVGLVTCKVLHWPRVRIRLRGD